MDSKYYCLTDTGRSFLVMHDFFIPSEEFPIHTQSDWELVYILRGRGTFIIGNRSQPFAENEGFLIPPDMLHGWIFDRSPGNEVEDICFVFKKELFKELSIIFPEMGMPGYLENKRQAAFKLRGGLLNRVKRELLEMLHADVPEQLSIVVRLLALLSRSDELNSTEVGFPVKKSDKKLQQIETYVSLNYTHNISIDDIATLVHMNRSSFCAFFKRTKGISFTGYLNAYRIDMACRLLTATDRTVSEIAYATGFNNLSHFCRTFLKYKGMSPSKYRRNI